ncbi:lysozyme inhibitor LprI family protein [Reyranella sp. CPCC 100927]|uniref:lysozyme inhibitor LprI family protein n=1 Tax=Reyranella sp. CPCC 100927 TaxID=2599616 RepID=UPI001C4989E8|nr:lysozyme inhibitor LprI family protein [Reyranella sp. CPCC 100927]
MDCRQASAPVEHAICSDRQLRAADAAMGDAYARLLKTANDADIRTMLIDGQKRWLAQRDRLFDRRLASADKDRQRTVMLSAMQDRTQALAERPLVAIAQGQRKFAARYTGGPFAGFETSCDFLPVQESYVYGCFARRQYQHNDRVCVVDAYWATGSVYEKRFVADVVDGKPKVIATCSVGGFEGETVCPGSPGDRPRWNTRPKDTVLTPSLPKIDAEVGPDEDGPWLRACLTDLTYPLRDPSHDSSRK